MGEAKMLKSSALRQPDRHASASASPPSTTVTKASGKQHTRSRSGCHTCRLRRKKCDERKPVCAACQHLGVECEYKRPSWWSHPDKRREHKERIKERIKQVVNQKKPLDKARRQQEQGLLMHPQQPVHPLVLPAASSPPSLCSDFAAHTRAASIDSGFSPQFSLGTPQDFFNATPMLSAQWTPAAAAPHQFPHMSPFEIDVKTERTMFMNDVPLHRDSTISTFNSYPQTADSTPLAEQQWVHEETFESRIESFAHESPELNAFQFSHPPMSPAHELVINVDECDQYLLNHFLENVAGLIFPILDASQQGSAHADVILPALETNRCYLHCCLSVAAMHLKATGQGHANIDDDIMRHRHATVSELCEAFNQDVDHDRILEATLALIFFQSSVAVPDDGLLDIPWHQHFHGVASLVDALQLLNNPLQLSPPQTPPSFNMTLASWIDIVGATMLGRVPVFADSYREKIQAGLNSGLAELMGCDDRVMYLISEIACLEALKAGGMETMQLCSHIQSLGTSLSLTEMGPDEVASMVSPSGAFRTKQLTKNVTALFRVAARIYLCSLVPDYDRSQPSVMALIDQFTDLASAMPAGTGGFDRSLVWPFLIVGANSTAESSFRKFLADRATQLGEMGFFGSFGRVRELLGDVWAVNDDMLAAGDKQSVSWRDVMHSKGWDFLLI